MDELFYSPLIFSGLSKHFDSGLSGIISVYCSLCWFTSICNIIRWIFNPPFYHEIYFQRIRFFACLLIVIVWLFLFLLKPKNGKELKPEDHLIL